MSINTVRSMVYAFALMVAPLVGAQQYTVTDFGNCGGLGYGFGINDSGTVVGYCTNGGSAERAFRSTPSGSLQDIGSLGGDTSNANGINNAGSVVGFSYLAGDVIFHAFLWTQTAGMQDLGTLGGPSSAAHAINNVGQVVGESYIAGSTTEYHVFLWSPSTGMQDLGTLPGLPVCFGLGINDSGEVVGVCQQMFSNSPKRAFLWSRAGGMKDLGTLGGRDSTASGINSAGEVVGTANTADNVPHAFFWTQSGGMAEIVTPGTAGQGFASTTPAKLRAHFFPRKRHLSGPRAEA